MGISRAIGYQFCNMFIILESSMKWKWIRYAWVMEGTLNLSQFRRLREAVFTEIRCLYRGRPFDYRLK